MWNACINLQTKNLDLIRQSYCVILTSFSAKNIMLPSHHSSDLLTSEYDSAFDWTWIVPFISSPSCYLLVLDSNWCFLVQQVSNGNKTCQLYFMKSWFVEKNPSNVCLRKSPNTKYNSKKSLSALMKSLMLNPQSSHSNFIKISLRLSMKFGQKLEAKQLLQRGNLLVLTLKSSYDPIFGRNLPTSKASSFFISGYEFMSLLLDLQHLWRIFERFWDTPQPASVNMAHLLPWKRSLILNHRMPRVLSPPVRSSLGNSPSMVLDRCEAPLLASWYFASCCVFSKGHCVGIVPIVFFKSKFFNNWVALRRGCFFRPLELFFTKGPMMSKGAFLSGTKLLRTISSRRLAASGKHGAMLQENSQSLGRGFLHLHQMPCGTCCGIFMMQGLAWRNPPRYIGRWWEWEKNDYSFKKLLGLTSLFPRRSIRPYFLGSGGPNPFHWFLRAIGCDLERKRLSTLTGWNLIHPGDSELDATNPGNANGYDWASEQLLGSSYFGEYTSRVTCWMASCPVLKQNNLKTKKTNSVKSSISVFFSWHRINGCFPK